MKGTVHERLARYRSTLIADAKIHSDSKKTDRSSVLPAKVHVDSQALASLGRFNEM
jgi:hypothetical protein